MPGDTTCSGGLARQGNVLLDDTFASDLRSVGHKIRPYGAGYWRRHVRPLRVGQVFTQIPYKSQFRTHPDIEVRVYMLARVCGGSRRYAKQNPAIDPKGGHSGYRGEVRAGAATGQNASVVLADGGITA